VLKAVKYFIESYTPTNALQLWFRIAGFRISGVPLYYINFSSHFAENVDYFREYCNRISMEAKEVSDKLTLF